MFTIIVVHIHVSYVVNVPISTWGVLYTDPPSQIEVNGTL